MKKMKAKIGEIILTIATILAFAMAGMYVMEFIIGMFWGEVRGETALICVFLAIGITKMVMEGKDRRKGLRTAKDFYEIYRTKVTASAILFVAEGKLTDRELNKFLSIMRYTARKNNWYSEEFDFMKKETC